MELCVTQRIKLDIFILRIDRDKLTCRNVHLEYQEEAAAYLDDALRLTSRKNYELILKEKSIFDMEILNVQILFEKPGPLVSRFIQFHVFLVDGRVHLEAIVLEINLHEQCDSLLLVVLDHYLLRDCVEVGEDTSNSPHILFNVVAMALFFFIATCKKHISNLPFGFLRANTRSDQLSRRRRGFCDTWLLLLLLITQFDDKATCHIDRICQGEN